MATLTDIRTGSIVKVNGDPYLVTYNQFSRKEAQKPVMRTKLKNLITGNVMDKTFSAGENFEMADIEKRKSQYLYNDGSEAYFMDNENFEQFTLPVVQLEGALKFMKENSEVYVTLYESKPIAVQPPIKVELKVLETPPGVRGDTAQGGTKPATLETGLTVNVPLFVNEEDTIIVNTDTGEYVSRA